MAIITVSSTADRGPGSLREAISQAKDGDSIRFSSNLRNKTIVLKSGQLVLNKSITIDGRSASGLTISGNSSSRVIQIEKNKNVTINSIRIANGRVVGAGGGIHARQGSSLTLINSKLENNKSELGGGLRVEHQAKATIIDSQFNGNDGTLTNNKAGFSAGAISTDSRAELIVKGTDFNNNRGFNGGAIYAYSTTRFEIEDSSFEGNTARNKAGGGAIFTDGINPFGPKYPSKGGTLSIQNSEFINNKTDGGGGALFLFGYGKDRTIIENSVFKGNSSSLSSKGIARGGAIQSNMGLTIKNSAFIDNSTEKQGGALWLNSKLPVDIVNSTFSGNRANGDAGGAMFLNTKSVPVNITNSTIAYNSAGRANGALWYSKSHAVKLTNSIVAFNTAQQDSRQNQVGFQAFDGGGNIEFSNDKRSMRVFAGSLVADPKLSPLREVNNTWVHALESGSPAINSGVKSGAVNDQRNFRRDSRIDIGAFEFGGTHSSGGSEPTPTPTPTPKPTPEPGPPVKVDIVGSNRNDSLRGTRKGEAINALAGNDIIKAKNGDDTLYGDLGNDSLFGGVGKDRLFGGDGRDILEGGKGNDILHGEEGKDTIVGVHTGAKNPGKREKDTMIGGGGADTFVLGDASKIYYVDGKSSSSGTNDYALIEDFSLSQGDRIQLFGNAGNYRLSAVSNGTGIYSLSDRQPELIGIIANQNISSINGDAFSFVL